MLRIAMWSGPRNISTAMMRAWENRGDTFVTDEPLYGYYLKQTGRPHPGADEVIRHCETDWQKVVKWLTSYVPEHHAIFYQKQMSHHLLPEMDRQWLAKLTHCFLIRHPQEVIASYLRKTTHQTIIEDLGFTQLLEIFQWVRQRQATVPPVLDAREFLQDPRAKLQLLCEALGIPFTERMLSWPAGPRATDGIWAKYWYHEVNQSTGFQPYKSKQAEIPAGLKPLYERCLECYEQLYEHRLR